MATGVDPDRAQAQIGAKDVAMLGPILHQGDEGADHLGIELGGFARVGKHRLLRIEEGDDIDIGGVVQLAAAMLTEREDGEAGGCGGGFRAWGELALGRSLAHQEVEHGVERRIAEIGEGGCGLGGRPEPAGFGIGR
jgi:hypothetical protein